MRFRHLLRPLLIFLVITSCLLILTRFFYRTYKNSELGIQFVYPSSWGDVLTKETQSGSQISLILSFSRNSDVQFTSITPNPNMNLTGFVKNEFLYTSGILTQFCNKAKRTGINTDETVQGTNGLDMVRLNGYYVYGDCTDQSGNLSIAKKSSFLPKTGNFLPITETAAANNSIAFTQNYYWRLTNPVYHSLNLEVKLPSVPSSNYCVYQIPNSPDSTHFRVDRCINHDDEQVILSTFSRFQASKLSRQIQKVVKSLKIKPVATNAFTNSMNNKAVYTSSYIPITFTYPAALKLVESPNSLELVLDNREYNPPIFQISWNTKESLIKEQAKLAALNNTLQDGGYEQQSSPILFDIDRRFFVSGQKGVVNCPQDKSSTMGNRSVSCQITYISNIPTIERYYRWTYLSKELAIAYTFYLEDKRFDINIRSPWIVPATTSAEFSQQRQTDFFFQISQQILNSLSVSYTQQ